MSGISNEGNVLGSAHKNSSFVKDITAFTKAFVDSKGDSKKLIKGFITTMKNDYGIDVSVQ